MEENTTALSAQDQCIELQDSTQEMLEIAVNNEQIESPDYSEMSLDGLMDTFQKMLQRGDQQELYKNAELIKDEVLADEVITGADCETSKEWNINGEKANLGVEKN